MAVPSPGELAALATALCWTVSALCFTAAGRRVGSLSVNIIRLTEAFLFLALYGLFARGFAFPTDAPAAAWFWLGISGFVGFFLGDLCLVKALVVIGPRLTMLLMSLSPPLAALLGFLVLGERLEPMSWLGMAVTLAGVSWVVLERRPDGSGAPWRPTFGGIVLGILAAAAQAGGAVLSKLGMGSENYDAFASTQIRVLAGIAGFATLLFFLRWYPRVFAALRDVRAISGITLGALAGPFLGVGLFLLSLQHITTGVSQTIVSIIPVLILPFVIVLYKERVSLRAAAGAVLAVAGVALLFWESLRKAFGA